jgi:uncharacterized protein (DUF2141 family)
MKRWISASATLVLATATVLGSAALQAATYGHAAAQDGLATVKVNISGFKGSEGVALVTLYDSAASWLKVPKAIQVMRLKITGATMTVEFKGVKPGTYAVSVIHDANKNNEMDMRWLPWPKPKEGSAASNDADAKAAAEAKPGPPKWEAAKFEVTAAGTSVKATMKYYD